MIRYVITARDLPSAIAEIAKVMNHRKEREFSSQLRAKTEKASAICGARISVYKELEDMFSALTINIDPNLVEEVPEEKEEVVEIPFGATPPAINFGASGAHPPAIPAALTSKPAKPAASPSVGRTKPSNGAPVTKIDGRTKAARAAKKAAAGSNKQKNKNWSPADIVNK